MSVKLSGRSSAVFISLFSMAVVDFLYWMFGLKIFQEHSWCGKQTGTDKSAHNDASLISMTSFIRLESRIVLMSVRFDLNSMERQMDLIVGPLAQHSISFVASSFISQLHCISIRFLFERFFFFSSVEFPCLNFLLLNFMDFGRFFYFVLHSSQRVCLCVRAYEFVWAMSERPYTHHIYFTKNLFQLSMVSSLVYRYAHTNRQTCLCHR